MAGKERIGFIGLGLMGGGMARTLFQAGYVLNVLDIDPRKMEAFQALGCRPMAGPKELGEKSEIVFSSLPEPSTVRNVYLETEGVIAGSASGSVLIDMSTVDPETSRAICRVAAAKKISYLDAPVSGGPQEAATGKLVITVGGDRTAFGRCKDLLGVLGPTIHYAGASGAGNVIKLVNNMMSMGNVLIAAEAMTLGVKAGVDGQTLFNILRTSGGKSHHLEKRFPNALARNFDPGFTVDLAKKDLGLAIEMAKSLLAPVPAASLIHQLYSVSSSVGDGQRDCVAIVKLFESWAGVQLQGAQKE